METELFRVNYSLGDIDSAVKRFWEIAGSYRVLAFSGEMGAGKTTFIHHLCDFLLVQDTVSSPTFALINEYHFSSNATDKIIYHLDWYRLKDTAEAISAGMEDCLDKAERGDAFCFVEWPEKALDLLRAPYLWITITTLPDEAHREMTVKRIG